jgi:hypothetical protein
MVALLDGQRFESTPDATVSAGKLLTGGAANVKGAYVELIASTTFDAFGFLLQLASAVGDMLFDVATGAATSEIIRIANIPISGNIVHLGSVWIPLNIPAGTRVSARVQSSAGAVVGTASITLVAGGPLAQANLGEALTYGAATADSGGTSIDAGAVANTKGAYSQMSASVTRKIRYLIVGFGNQINTIRTAANFLADISYGAATSELVIVPDLHFRADATSDILDPAFHALPCNIPEGSRVAIRTQSQTTDATDRLADAVIVGFG